MNTELYGSIEIRGARENNLKSVSLDIPKRQITVVTGVSGSGKSSLVFDTIGAEAQRGLNDTFTMFQRTFLPRYSQPDVDSIKNLSAPIIINQNRIGGNQRSTVGTITDIYTLMRLLFSRAGVPSAGPAVAYSFNHPMGMCPVCDGIGLKREVDLGKLIDVSKSINEGPFRHPNWKLDTWHWKMFALSGFFDNDKKLRDFTPDEMEKLLRGKDGKKVKFGAGKEAINMTFEGIVEKFERLFLKRDTNELSEATRAETEAYITSVVCPACHGTRLNAAAVASRINGRNIAEMSAMEATALVEVLREVSGAIGETVAGKLVERLEDLIDIGLGYLSLNRETGTLSGGESQRIKMVRHLDSSLTDVLYVLDEPSIGLHPQDVSRLNQTLRKLRDKGNTVIVVEHDPDVIAIADHVVDVGPKAGSHGGEIVYQGDVAGLAKADTLTGRFMSAALPLKDRPRRPDGTLPLRHATRNNLQDVSVDIPKGVLTVVTGVAGSGKSSLISEEFLTAYAEAIVIDQSAIGASSRSTPATYTGIMDPVRELFAKANKATAALFSFNSKGACPTCKGLGIVTTDLAALDSIETVCETCEGKRFSAKVLEMKLRGRSIAEVLNLPVEAARDFFDEKDIAPILAALDEVGLGYVTLGQSVSTLSGGERQRLKLATELGSTSRIYVMDEPTTGLHMSDTERLIGLFDRLVDGGSTVIVIEHNLDVIARADWVIDMGPGAGHEGGRVIFEGKPADLARTENSATGRFLARRLRSEAA